MTLSRTTITKNTIGSFNFFDEVMAMTMTKKDELQQTSSISSSNSSSMNLFQEVEQEVEQQNKQENKGNKRSRYF